MIHRWLGSTGGWVLITVSQWVDSESQCLSHIDDAGNQFVESED